MPETTNKVTIPCTVQISHQQIESLIVCAMEDGARYWCDLIKKNKKVEYCNVVFEEGGVLTFEESEDEELPSVQHTLNLAGCIKGLEVMAAKYPHHFADVVNENDDVNTGDVFLQCCFFGELKYG